DVITLSEFLKKRKKLRESGGFSYLGELAKNTPSAANITAYAAIVRENALLREVIQTSVMLINSAYMPNGAAAEEILSAAEREIFRIAGKRQRKSGFVTTKHALVRVVDRIDALYNAGEDIIGVSTGLSDIDKITTGLQPSDLIIVAGRPSMGKTAFALGIAAHAATTNDPAPVAFFSMEMPVEQMLMRLLSMDSLINMQKIRTGKLEDDDWPLLTKSIGKIAEIPLFVDETPALSPTDLRARARRLAYEHEGQLKLIVIDYIQLMQVPGNKENRATELSQISRELKALAKELNVPVVALSQLNRNLEQRADKRPIMSDLRESGSLEQDSDLIAFIYRDEVYNDDSEEKGTAEIIIAKQRNGPIGTKRLSFMSACAKFF
ncbi:MAG: replicative DNA helicase, partial [Gammaproteobacteria bacterium]|nr:replicative DNA helicase [Gammaproteobacteria bacterium]